MSKQIRNRCPAALLCEVIALAIMIPSFASLVTVVGAKNRAVLLADLTKGDTNVDDTSYNIRANNWEDSTTFSENGAHISFPSGGNGGALQVRLQNVDLSSKKYIYFKITKDAKDGNNSAWMERMQIQQTSGSWKAHAASKLEWKAPGGEWSASTDNTFVMYNNDNERWFRYETAEFVNDGFTAVNNGYVIYIRFTPWHECAVTVSNVYLANKDVDVPGVIDEIAAEGESKAVRVADMTNAKLDANNFSDSTVINENGLSFTVPEGGSSGWFVSEATDGFSMKEIAQQIYEQNPYANGASVKNVLKEVYHVG